MRYVALFEEEKRGLAVSFPDFPDCVTFGEDLDEAVDHAHEALSSYVEMLVEEGASLPEPTDKKAILARPENAGRKAINVDVAGDGTDWEEFEVAMHRHLLARIEKYADSNGVSPADFLAAAARLALREDVFGR